MDLTRQHGVCNNTNVITNLTSCLLQTDKNNFTLIDMKALGSFLRHMKSRYIKKPLKRSKKVLLSFLNSDKPRSLKTAEIIILRAKRYSITIVHFVLNKRKKCHLVLKINVWF